MQTDTAVLQWHSPVH